jgi:hypothetical protein
MHFSATLPLNPSFEMRAGSRSVGRVDDEGPTMPTQIATSSETDQIVQRIWPSAIIALGFGLTGAWACFLAYVLVVLIDRAV